MLSIGVNLSLIIDIIAKITFRNCNTEFLSIWSLESILNRGQRSEKNIQSCYHSFLHWEGKSLLFSLKVPWYNMWSSLHFWEFQADPFGKTFLKIQNLYLKINDLKICRVQEATEKGEKVQMKNRLYCYKVLHIELSFQVIYHSLKLLCCQLWILKNFGTKCDVRPSFLFWVPYCEYVNQIADL